MNSTAVTQPRILAPDVARGFTMLGIAIANATTAWLYIAPSTPGSTAGGVVDNSILDKIAIILGSIFTHVRGMPMFATLLGYGVGMIAMSLQRRNYPPKKARLVLIRRYFFLAIFGILHLSLLFFGDIMFVYGVMGIILALLYRFKDKTLLIITGVLGTIGLAFVSFIVIRMTSGYTPPNSDKILSFLSTPESYATLVSHAFTALSFQIDNLVTGLFLFFPIMILGMVAARHNVLGQPEKYKTLLTRFAIVAVIISFGVGIPLGLTEIGVLPENIESYLQILNQVAGVWAGPGIVASIALATIPLQRRIDAAHANNSDYPLPIPLQALIALGKRSMTGYLLQSILFVLLTSTFTIGLGRGQGAWEASLVATLIWAITLAIAYALEKTNLRGPFEAVHRRLSYGRTGQLNQFTPQ